MTCKYFDCGFCYAPEDVKNNSVQGACIEPEYCATYLMQKKPKMTDKEHLECEIKELQLEIEEHGKSIQKLINVQNRRKQKLEELEQTFLLLLKLTSSVLKHERHSERTCRMLAVHKRQIHVFNLILSNS